MERKIKILLDTDIGSDIDDCFALAYLLRRSDVELVGITTTTGHCEMRAQLAHKICSDAGVNIPVHVGEENPLTGKLRQPEMTKAQSAVSQTGNKKYSNENTAVEFLRKTIEAAPGEITLVCIGPLTNAALLFSRYPHLAGLLAGMAIMGGRYAENEFFDTAKWGSTEWNILCDTKAAEVVFKQRVKNTVVIGVEQTCRFYADSVKVRQAFAKLPDLNIISQCISPSAERVWFHDAIIIYSLLYPSEVAWSRGNIQIEESFDGYLTKLVPDINGRHMVITDYSLQKFSENYEETVGLERFWQA